jgi:predicted metal-binding membrane protein
MWAVMMVPAASPMILLFAEINRRRNEGRRALLATGMFRSGYLAVWTVFSAKPGWRIRSPSN